jgi:hypothetical protein
MTQHSSLMLAVATRSNVRCGSIVVTLLLVQNAFSGQQEDVDLGGVGEEEWVGNRTGFDWHRRFGKSTSNFKASTDTLEFYQFTSGSYNGKTWTQMRQQGGVGPLSKFRAAGILMFRTRLGKLQVSTFSTATSPTSTSSTVKP